MFVLILILLLFYSQKSLTTLKFSRNFVFGDIMHLTRAKLRPFFAYTPNECLYFSRLQYVHTNNGEAATRCYRINYCIIERCARVIYVHSINHRCKYLLKIIIIIIIRKNLVRRFYYYLTPGTGNQL